MVNDGATQAQDNSVTPDAEAREAGTQTNPDQTGADEEIDKRGEVTDLEATASAMASAPSGSAALLPGGDHGAETAPTVAADASREADAHPAGPLAPSVPFISSMGQRTTIRLLDNMAHHWLKKDALSPLQVREHDGYPSPLSSWPLPLPSSFTLMFISYPQAQWIYALLAGLDRQQSDRVMALLRTLMRHCTACLSHAVRRTRHFFSMLCVVLFSFQTPI